MTVPDSMKQKLAGAKSQIEGMGAVLKVQYGPAAFALYKAYVDRKAFLELSGFILADYLPKSKYDLYMKAQTIQVEGYLDLIVEAGNISKEVQGIVQAEVAKAELIHIDLMSAMEGMLNRS